MGECAAWAKNLFDAIWRQPRFRLETAVSKSRWYSQWNDSRCWLQFWTILRHARSSANNSSKAYQKNKFVEISPENCLESVCQCYLIINKCLIIVSFQLRQRQSEAHFAKTWRWRLLWKWNWRPRGDVESSLYQLQSKLFNVCFIDLGLNLFSLSRSPATQSTQSTQIFLQLSLRSRTQEFTWTWTTKLNSHLASTSRSMQITSFRFGSSSFRWCPKFNHWSSWKFLMLHNIIKMFKDLWKNLK